MPLTNNGGTGFQPVKEFKIYRRNLPHWENPESVYFITFRTAKNFLLRELTRDVIKETCLFHSSTKYDLLALVVMPDHVHILLQPMEKGEKGFYPLAEILHSIKSYSANQINKILKRRGTVWLDESFDRIVRDANELQEKLNYIINNPLENGLVEKTEDYKWLYVKGWLDKDTGKMPVPP